jgi:hypothetical protein
MKTLKELLNAVDPELTVDESLESDLVAIVEAAAKTARKEGFEQGFEEAHKEIEKLKSETDTTLSESLKEAEDKHKQEMIELEEKIDNEHSKTLEEIIEKIDNDHTEKLQDVVESLDKDHTEKFEHAIATIDEDHTEKLQAIKEYYENHHQTDLAEMVSDYLETYLEEVTPEDQLIDKIKLERLEKAFNSMREVLLFNDDYVRTEIAEAVEDAKNRMDEQQSTINELMMEKIELTKKIKKNEAENLLESKTKDMPSAEAAFIKKYFADADAKEISEKLDEAVAAYEAQEAEERDALVESANQDSTIVEVPTDNVEEIEEINENVNNIDDSFMNDVVGRINKSFQARK